MAGRETGPWAEAAAWAEAAWADEADEADEVAQRTVAADRRTGTTTAELWPPGHRPELLDTRDIDDWLALIAAGRGVGVTPEGTTGQYRRDGVVFRPLRDAPPIAVHLGWRRHDPHPATFAAVALLTDLYQRGGERGARNRSRNLFCYTKIFVTQFC